MPGIEGEDRVPVGHERDEVLEVLGLRPHRGEQHERRTLAGSEEITTIGQASDPAAASADVSSTSVPWAPAQQQGRPLGDRP